MATLEELRSSKPVVAAQVGKAPGAVAMLGAAAAKWVVPLTVGGIATYAIGARIASGIGDTLETESQRRTRRTGALVGMGAVGAATSAMLVAGSNAAMRGLPGTPPLLHTMLSRGVVGIGLGAAALGAFGIKSHMSNDPAQAETAS